MYLQKAENGCWFVKFGTQFEYYGNIDKEDKKTLLFEEYIWDLYANQKLNIQLVWKLNNIIDFTEAILNFESSDGQLNCADKLQNYGEFFCYLYKEDEQRRPAITIEYNDDEYNKTLDISNLDITIFDYSTMSIPPYDTTNAYFDWIKLNKEDFWFVFDPKNNNIDTVMCSIKLDKLLSHLEKSNNVIYNQLFKDFNLKYFENKFPENGRKTKKTKI